MRFLHTITSMDGDGAQRMLLRLVSALEPRGHTNTVVVLKDRCSLAGAFEAAGAELHFLSMSKGIGAAKGLRSLASLIRRGRPDILQGWMYHANLALLAASRMARCRAPVVWSIRRSLYDYAERKTLTRLMIRLSAECSRSVDAIIYPAQVCAEHHRARGFAPREEYVIPNGFDTGCPTAESAAGIRLRERLGIPYQALTVGNAGRYDKAKDHATFLAAAQRVSRAVPDARFLLAGREVTEGNRRLSSTIDELGLRGRVHLLGELRDLSPFFAALDLYCSSSLSEGFPNALAEAMLQRVPCVATDVGASRELIGDTGGVVPPGDEAALAAALTRLLGESMDDRARRGGAARRRVVDRFSIEAMAARYAACAEEISRSRGSDSRARSPFGDKLALTEHDGALV